MNSNVVMIIIDLRLQKKFAHHFSCKIAIPSADWLPQLLVALVSRHVVCGGVLFVLLTLDRPAALQRYFLPFKRHPCATNSFFPIPQALAEPK